MQTILGSGGAIGTELANILTQYSGQIRLVSRNPKKVNDTDLLFPCDLVKSNEVFNAVNGSEVCYLTAGLAYNTKIWQNTWPVIMKNVINACIKYKSKLVFFDNVYMYDPEYFNNITEDTPVNPVSKKGKVREEISQILINEVKSGNVKACIARSADFYGPGINNSILLEMVYNNLKNGKKANWFCSKRYKHSFTYTLDAAKATAILGNSDQSFGQIWHLPTSPDPLTGEEWIHAFASQMETLPKSLVISKFLVKMLGVFNPVLKELSEILYQYDRDYIFNSSKFESTFQFTPTPYFEGIKNIIEAK